MKVLIADDERPIREWLGMTLEKMLQPTDCILTAANGKEAYEKYLAEAPDLIITDIRMPVMTGLELMEEVKKKDEHLPFVVLTCHEEFSYARKALQMGAYEYLLKTEIEEQQLRRVLEKAAAIRQGRSPKDDYLFDRQQLILNVMEHGLTVEPGLLEEVNAYEPDKSYFFMAFHSDGQGRVSELRKKLCFERYRCEIFPYHKDILFGMVWTKRVSSQMMQIQRVQEFAGKAGGQLLGSLGFSRIYLELSFVKRALQEALEQLNRGFYQKGRAGFADFCTERIKAFDFEKETAQIISGIFLNHRNEIIEEIEKWLSLIEEDGTVDSEQFKSACLRILQKLKEKYSLLTYERTDILEAESFWEVKEYLHSIEEMLKDVNAPGNSVNIQKALKYIEEHYGDSCSLEQISGAIGLNSEYFSRLFKQNMKQTYNGYLTEYRIRMAKTLLLNTQESISEVAEKVGYRNLAYFSRVFKKQTGQTPFEYRAKS